MPIFHIIKGFKLSVAIPVIVGVFCIVYIALNAIFIYSAERERTIRQELNFMREQALQLAAISDLAAHSQSDLAQLGIQNILNDPKVDWLAFVAPDGNFITSSTKKSSYQLTETQLSDSLIDEIKRAIENKTSITSYDSQQKARIIHPEQTESTPRWAIVLEKDLKETLDNSLEHTFTDASRAAVVNIIGCFVLCWGLKRYLNRRVNQLIQESNLLTQFPDQEPDKIEGDEFDHISKLLHQSDRRLHAIAASIPDVFYVISINLDRTFYVSPAYKDIWGPDVYDPANPTLNWLHLVTPEDRPHIEYEIERIKKGAPHFEVEFRAHWNNTDKIRWLYTRAFPVKSASGQFEFLVGFTRDVTKQKQLEEEVLNISENERRNIGHDLHDDLCQRLAALRLRSEILSDQLAKKNLGEAMIADDLAKKIGGAVQLCRNLALGLSPVNIEREGLMHALELLAEDSSSMHQIPCKFSCPDTILIRNNASATHLYRITQELINNAARHAKPSYINIRLLKEARGIRLEVEHDKVCFSPNTVGEHAGMGLRILRYRANALGSSLHFEPLSEPQIGTVASIFVSETFC